MVSSRSARRVPMGVVTGTVTATDPDNDPLITPEPPRRPGCRRSQCRRHVPPTPTADARHAAAADGAAGSLWQDGFTVTASDGNGASWRCR